MRITIQTIKSKDIRVSTGGFITWIKKPEDLEIGIPEGCELIDKTKHSTKIKDIERIYVYEDKYRIYYNDSAEDVFSDILDLEKVRLSFTFNDGIIITLPDVFRIEKSNSDLLYVKYKSNSTYYIKYDDLSCIKVAK